MTLLLHDNSDMWRMIASLPDCPLVSSLSDVSSEWPRLSPARAPSPDSQRRCHKTANHKSGNGKIRQSQNR